MSRMSDLNYLQRSDPQQARRTVRLAAERYQAHLDLLEAGIRYGKALEGTESYADAHTVLTVAAKQYAEAVKKERRHG